MSENLSFLLAMTLLFNLDRICIVDQVELCKTKEAKIVELQEELEKQKSAEKSITDDISIVHSPSLFSQTDTEAGFPEEASNGSYLPGQQMPHDDEDPDSEEGDLMDTGDLEEDLFGYALKGREIPRKSGVTKESTPLEPGWKKKPSRLSFTSMDNKTMVYSPKKTMKNQSIVDCLKHQQQRLQNTPPKVVGTPTINQVIQIDDDRCDKKEEELRTPKKKRIGTEKRATRARPPPLGEPNQDLSDFCDECREVIVYDILKAEGGGLI